MPAALWFARLSALFFLRRLWLSHCPPLSQFSKSTLFWSAMLACCSRRASISTSKRTAASRSAASMSAARRASASLFRSRCTSMLACATFAFSTVSSSALRLASCLASASSRAFWRWRSSLSACSFSFFRLSSCRSLSSSRSFAAMSSASRPWNCARASLKVHLTRLSTSCCLPTSMAYSSSIRCVSTEGSAISSRSDATLASHSCWRHRFSSSLSTSVHSSDIRSMSVLIFCTAVLNTSGNGGSSSTEAGSASTVFPF
mmetsp:Transcript_5418/g.19810  ORF Transcript_5418/g.19810 Transcript_5418/m.19810 type:complete len:259 (+) Transcript_5418:2495-3271(+)